MATRILSLSLTGRGVALATIAALAITMSDPPSAVAGPIAAAASSGATDFSSARRVRHHRRGGSAAGLAFMGLAIGAIGAVAAQQRRNDYYNNGYYNNGYYNNGYGYAPGYYGGGGPYYGRRY